MMPNSISANGRNFSAAHPMRLKKKKTEREA